MADDLAALRDRLAVACGWTWNRYIRAWCKPGHTPTPNPFPEGDLTALAAAWPEGWAIKIRLYSDGWYAYGRVLDCSLGWKYDACQCSTEYEARLRLNVAVREAMASDPP